MSRISDLPRTTITEHKTNPQQQTRIQKPGGGRKKLQTQNSPTHKEIINEH